MGLAEKDDKEARDLASEIGDITLRDELANNTVSRTHVILNDKLSNDINSRKQATVGSLDFNSSSKQSSTLPTEEVRKDAGKVVKKSKKQGIAVRKHAVRTKVPFEKGYSQMDWLKLTRTHPDLAGICETALHFDIMICLSLSVNSFILLVKTIVYLLIW